MDHSIDYRVYYEDTDAGGVVFYANYLRFAERGRTEMLRSIGVENRALHQEVGILFVVRKLTAEYLMTGHLDDVFTVKTSVKTLNNASIDMKQAIFRHDSVLFTMDITLVCINLQGKPVRVPDDLRAKLAPYMETE